MIPPSESPRPGWRSQAALPIILLAAWTFVAPPAHAHQPGTSSLVLATDGGGQLRGELHVADVDLAAIRLMLSSRARRTDQPLAGAPGNEIAPGASGLPWLRLMGDGRELPFVADGPRPADTDGRIHTMIPFVADAAGIRALRVEYVDFFDFDPQHKVVASLEAGGSTRVGLLSYENPYWETSLEAPGPLSQFLRFTWEGVWHIWIGIDHILFLLALLLPSVLAFRDGRWHPVGGFRQALLNVVRVVTAFTVAHSVTLSIASLQWVTLPSRFVESVIALSVLLAALNNLWPVVSNRAWIVAFGFGLIHGFGFATVLADLQLPTGTLAVALLSFNLGVELGQLVIVSAFFPLAFALREHALYQTLKLRMGSALIGLIAVGWMVQRVFGLEVVPF